MKSVPSALIICAAAVTLFCLPVSAAEKFHPGDVWPDDRGRHIQAHGGGILKLGGTFYWFGEDRSQQNGSSRRYVSCYSSTNLAPVRLAIVSCR